MAWRRRAAVSCTGGAPQVVEVVAAIAQGHGQHRHVVDARGFEQGPGRRRRMLRDWTGLDIE